MTTRQPEGDHRLAQRNNAEVILLTYQKKGSHRDRVEKIAAEMAIPVWMCPQS
jgi:3-phenylpropionate/cinnamic acid dioxygenase small subunit